MPTPTQTNIPLDFRQKHYDGTSSDADDGVLVFDRFAKKIYVSGVEYYPDFTGATKDADGTSGTVPAPLAGEHRSILLGDSQWHAREEVCPSPAYRVPFGLQISKGSQATLNEYYKPTLLFYAAGKADQLTDAALFLNEISSVSTRQTQQLTQLSSALTAITTSVSFTDFQSAVSNVTNITSELISLYNGVYRNRHIFRNCEYQGFSVFFQPTEYMVTYYDNGGTSKMPYSDFDFDYEPDDDKYIKYISDIRTNSRGWTYPRAKYLSFVDVDSELSELNALIETLGTFVETDYTDAFDVVSDYILNGYNQFSDKHTAYVNRLNAFITYNGKLKDYAESFTGDSTTDTATATSNILDTLSELTTALNNDDINDNLAALADFIEDMRVQINPLSEVGLYLSNTSSDYIDFGNKLNTYLESRTEVNKNAVLSSISTLTTGINNPSGSGSPFIGYMSVYRIYRDAYCVAYNIDLRRDKIDPDYFSEFRSLITQRHSFGLTTANDYTDLYNAIGYLLTHEFDWSTGVAGVLAVLNRMDTDFVYNVNIPNGTSIGGDVRFQDKCDRVVCAVSYNDHIMNGKGECLESMTVRFDDIRSLWIYALYTISPTFRGLENDHDGFKAFAIETHEWIRNNLWANDYEFDFIRKSACGLPCANLNTYFTNYLQTLYRTLRHRSGIPVYLYLDDTEDINVVELYDVINTTIQSIWRLIHGNYTPSDKTASANLANMLYERYNLSRNYLNIEIFKGVTDSETEMDGSFTDSGLEMSPAGLVPSASLEDSGKVLSANGKWINIVNKWDIYDQPSQ